MCIPHPTFCNVTIQTRKLYNYNTVNYSSYSNFSSVSTNILFSVLGSSRGAHITSGYVSRVQVKHKGVTKHGSGKKDDVGKRQRKTSKKKVMLELDLESSGRIIQAKSYGKVIKNKKKNL